MLITFFTKMFQDSSEQDFEDSKLKLLVLFKALVKVNQIYLASHPDTIQLYDSDVVYQPEFGTEEWQDIPTTLERGFGDCEDLAAYRVAELRNQGIKANPHIRWRMVDGSYRFHALVKWPDTHEWKSGRRVLVKGRVEDPSLRLGMRKWSGFLSAKNRSDF